MPCPSCERCTDYPIECQVWGGYQVGEALAILKAKPRRATRLRREDIAVRRVWWSVQGTEAHVPHVDARRPCIAIRSAGRHTIIDGNHRAAKQLGRGRAVRAYVLTAAEAKQTKED